MAVVASESSKSGHGRELLSFRVGAQDFCIDISVVREIRGWTPTTPMPHAPSYMRGVVNLRGAALPIMDLADRLGIHGAEPTPQHVIIVVEVNGQAAGLLVSAVSDILTINEQSIQPTPEVASSVARTYVRGLLTVEDRMVALLCADELVPTAELEAA